MVKSEVHNTTNRTSSSVVCRVAGREGTSGGEKHYPRAPLAGTEAPLKANSLPVISVPVAHWMCNGCSEISF